MVTPEEIRKKTERLYASFLLASVKREAQFFPCFIKCNKGIETMDSFEDFSRKLSNLQNQSKEKRGYGYEVKYKVVRTKMFGTQGLPVSISFSTRIDFLRFLGKEAEADKLIDFFKTLCQEFPECQDWVSDPRMLKFVSFAKRNELELILDICRYFKNNPYPNLYIRELPVKADTKFIETNKSILRMLLDVILKNYLNPDEQDFEKRFHLKVGVVRIHFRMLDIFLSKTCFSGLTDIEVQIGEFENLDIPIRQVIIVENKTNLYTLMERLPQMKHTLAIWGSGFKVTVLRSVEWMKRLPLYYWGDIDAHGFEILSQVRQYFPHTISMLMDETTWNNYPHTAGKPTQTDEALLHLHADEMKLYRYVRALNLRLEQEKIKLPHLKQALIENKLL